MHQQSRAHPTDPTEDCMILEADNGGTWDDRSCRTAYPYFCALP